MLRKLLEFPYPLRVGLLHKLRCRLRGFSRDSYVHCLERAAAEAKALGFGTISAIEFGVAGGNGLVDLEKIARSIERRHGVKVEVYGFDRAVGLPPSTDYRDAPFRWQEGWYQMDVEKLRARLSSAVLILGDIKDTVGSFIAEHNPAPIGAVFFDVDYYSSCKDCLTLFDHDGHDRFLPRVMCYFDDIASIRSIGEFLAIDEFNRDHEFKVIERSERMFRSRDPFLEQWKVFEYHDFHHPLYCKPVHRQGDLRLRR